MNNNSQRRFFKTKKAKRREAASQPRLSKKPKVGYSADKFCRKTDSGPGMTMQEQAKIFYGACYKEN